MDVTFGGATHDSFVFSNSKIKEVLENLNNNGEKIYLLGKLLYTIISRYLCKLNSSNKLIDKYINNFR